MLSCVSVQPHVVHTPACGCLAPAGGVSRRGFLAFSGAAIGSAVLAGQALAASGDYEAMLVNCIDPRFTTNSGRYMAANGMQDRYSHFVVAGGPIGAINPQFASWHSVFWENLDISVQLHNIKRVVAITHRDCGAAKIAFGDVAVGTRDAETAAHAQALRAFAAEVRRRKPSLAVVAGIMDLNGTVDAVS